jgi:hypothetical protein
MAKNLQSKGASVNPYDVPTRGHGGQRKKTRSKGHKAAVSRFGHHRSS